MVIQEDRIKSAIGNLREILSKANSGDKEFAEMVKAKDAVLARFGHAFKPENLPKLTPQEFTDFLLIKNNRHWKGIHRQGGIITADMDRLRDALLILLDEERPIRTRLTQLVPLKGDNYVKWLSKAILTPILMMVYPEQYSVWNNMLEGAFRTLKIWPNFSAKTTFGEKYEQLNGIQSLIAKELEVDRWTLDALWWRVQQPNDSDISPVKVDDKTFGLEAHLHEFILDNWGRIDLGQEWDIFQEDGETVGSEYSCDAGIIDILAKHRIRPELLVIELKRGQTSDDTIGQICRYMGWVSENLCKGNEIVRGLIIAHEFDKNMWYALKNVNNVDLQKYEVDFHLRAVTPLNNPQ